MPISDRSLHLPPVFLALGGTGVIGSALADHLRKSDIGYVSISLDKPARTASLWNIQIDLNTVSFEQLESELRSIASHYSVVGILDIIGVHGRAADAVSSFADAMKIKVGLISSCLLYDHDGSGPVDESIPTINPTHSPHHYVKTKSNTESIWENGQFQNWLILRTNHVIGRNGLLGCIPNHNRDRNLLETLRNGGKLALANYGEFKLSFIHPDDLVALSVKLIQSGNLFATVVNLVNPSPVVAKDYYKIICDEMNYPAPKIVNYIPRTNDFWSTTARNNEYVSKFEVVQNFPFSRTIEASISDALSVGEAEYRNLGEHMFKRISG